MAGRACSATACELRQASVRCRFALYLAKRPTSRPHVKPLVNSGNQSNNFTPDL